MRKKVLIIRFSSFGDIVQCMSTLAPLAVDHEVHWLVKKEFSQVLSMSGNNTQVISFDKENGLSGLIKLAISLRKNKFDIIYDAHSNIRSRIVCIVLSLFSNVTLFRRSKDRIKRLLFFKFRMATLPVPYLGILSYLEPIKEIIEYRGRKTKFSQKSQFNSTVVHRIDEILSNKFSDKFVTLAPSAAWEMKRWPLNYWKELIELCPKTNFCVLGGPEDKFCQELEDISLSRVLNMAGKASLIESCYIVSRSNVVISGDTGILHVADIQGIKTIAIIGPTAFGFPTSLSTDTVFLGMDCAPCSKDGRGKCSQAVYKKCLIDITPQMIAEKLKLALN